MLATQGINEEQTVANLLRTHTAEQARLNAAALATLVDYQAKLGLGLGIADPNPNPKPNPNPNPNPNQPSSATRRSAPRCRPPTQAAVGGRRIRMCWRPRRGSAAC